MKKQTYLKGAMILVAANLIVKVIGALFKIPLANIIQEEGMAIFSTAYQLYTCMFVIATAGLPVAVSKMVSASLAQKKYIEVNKIFKAALSLLTLIGLAGSLFLFIVAKQFSGYVGSEASYLSILAIAPAVFFVALLSAFRGYFQGFSDMLPTAFSEVIEAMGKLCIGLLLAYLLLPTGTSNAPAGAILGVTAGTFFALMFMVIAYALRRKKQLPMSLNSLENSRSTKSIFLELAKIAIPITIGAAVTSLTSVIDMVMIRRRLQTILVTPEIYQTLTEFYGLPLSDISIGKLMQPAYEGAKSAAEILYGAYSGYAIPMFNLPPTIIMALSLSVVPFISAAFAVKNMSEVKKLSESTIRITTLFSVPCAVGLSVLSQPILIAVYNNARAASMLHILSFAVIFVSLVSVTTAMLQGAGYVYLPVRNMLIGGLVKIITNYVLVAIPALNIGGAPISTLLCYFVIAVLNIMCVKKIMKPGLSLGEFVMKPMIASGAMGLAAYGAYQLVAKTLHIAPLSLSLDFLPQTAPSIGLLGSERLQVIIAVGISILAAVIVYAVMIFVLKMLKKDDVLMMPKGEPLARILERFHLI